ncbi:MAG: hypothetical protein A2016_11375 [Elusimicrobia bacterium GWF2_62_30]|nr:MAG: hypothetical protein A2016_11375 [Elusimicrobia bacterium GWF2_62_30]
MGIDFNAVYSFGVGLREGTSAYFQAANCYPPFVTVALLPLTFFPPHLAYSLYVLVLMLALFAMTFACLKEGEELLPANELFYALIITALLFFSYPVNFAFERGNSDLVAGSFAAFSLFAMSRGWFFPSIIALTISTQFKVYPAVLIVLLSTRFGVRAAVYFFALNAAALFILGMPAFLHFTSSLQTLTEAPSAWQGNHSLYAYVSRLAKKGFIFSDSQGLARKLSYLFFTGLFCAAWVKSWLSTRKHFAAGGQKRGCHLSGSEIGLTGMSFTLMSLLPAVSYDYKLAIQVVPFLLLLSRPESQLFESHARARTVAALAAALMALLLLPRDLVSVLKTPWLILLFILYFYLAWTGKKTCPGKISAEKGEA